MPVKMRNDIPQTRNVDMRRRTDFHDSRLNPMQIAGQLQPLLWRQFVDARDMTLVVYSNAVTTVRLIPLKIKSRRSEGADLDQVPRKLYPRQVEGTLASVHLIHPLARAVRHASASET